MKKLPVVVVVVALTTLLASACATRSSAIPSGRAESDPAPVLHTVRTRAAVDPPSLTYLVEVRGLGLFEEERAEAEALVAAWASEQGLRVVPIDKAREMTARARSGRHAETGEACGRPLAPFVARSRWRAALGADGILEAAVRCSREPGECQLRVTAKDRLDGDAERVLERVAPFAHDASWREALPLALPALAAPPKKEGGGLGGLGLSGRTASVVEAKPERLNFSASQARATDRLDPAKIRDGLSFPEGQAPLRACFERSEHVDLLLEIDADGRVARCESRSADEEVSRCACEAFVAHATARPNLRSRRVHVGASFTPADTVTPANVLVSAGVRAHLRTDTNRRGVRVWRPVVTHPSIEHWRPPAALSVERCFVDVEEPGQLEWQASVRFDARGNAVAVEVQPDATGLSDAQRACVTRALEEAHAPCPATGGAVAEARVWMRVERIGEPRAGPRPKESDDG